MNAWNLYLMFWCGYTLFMVGIAVIAIVWAIRNKQFNRQKNAGNLPLEIDEVSKIKNQPL